MLQYSPKHAQALAEKCRRSFYSFFLEFWGTIEPVAFQGNWHVKIICDALQQVYETWQRGESQADVLINQPPGTTKSTAITQMFPAWLWVKNAGIRTISSSYAASLSVSHSVKSRDVLTSDKFAQLFPGLIEFKKDADGKTDYRNTRGGQRFSTSTGGAVTGIHADFIILDDPLNPQLAASEAGLAGAKKHLETLSTRKTDKARSVTILVMQRLHELDPSGIWLKSGAELNHICLPGELTLGQPSNVKPPQLQDFYRDGLLDPVRLTRASLAELKLKLGTYGYSGQIGQRPSPEEGGVLKKAWFRRMTMEEFLKTVPGAATAIRHGDADTAYTANTRNDPSALLISCLIQGTLYVIYVGELWLEAPALITELPRLCQAYGFNSLSKLHVEPKASGKTVVQMLRTSTRLNVVEAPAPSTDKTQRVATASPFIQGGRVVIIDGSGGEKLVEQAAGFPNAAHDDMLDTLTQAIARAQKPKGGYDMA